MFKVREGNVRSGLGRIMFKGMGIMFDKVRDNNV